VQHFVNELNTYALKNKHGPSGNKVELSDKIF